MTAEQIDALAVGPRLDAVVEEALGLIKIEEYKWVGETLCFPIPDSPPAGCDPGYTPVGVGKYSTDMAQAWKVLRGLDIEWWPEVGRMNDGAWYCEICKGADVPDGVGPPIRVVAPTAPEAICRAFLKLTCAHCGTHLAKEA